MVIHDEKKNDMRREAVDVEGIGVDWAGQRARINGRIDAAGARRSLRPAWYGAVAAVLVAAIAIIIWWHHSAGVARQEELNQFFTEIDSISDDYVPAGLYVLNGYLNEQPDAEAMVEFMLPEEGDKEEL